MKLNFTKDASLFLLVLTIIVTGCGHDSNSSGPDNKSLSINSISPTSGAVGTKVTIDGTGFSSEASNNTVTFTGDVEASVSSASESELVVNVPDGAMTGTITAEVGDESATSSDFTVEGGEQAEIPDAYNSLPGNKTIIAQDETWANDTTIVGPHYVLPGITLTVEVGVTVDFQFHDNNSDDVGTIITLPGDKNNFSDGPRPSGRLVAEGTADNPIIFTSSHEQVASWGGIILAGNASNNIIGGQGEIEGLSSGVQYGADIDGGDSFKDDDDSGILSYVQINYSGYSISDGSELQALTLYSVGSATKLDHISVYQSVDDGVEFFGGTVDLQYFVVVGAQDDTFDGDQGWRGRGQFWLGVQTEGLPTNRGFENDGCADQANCSGGNGPSEFHVYNATVWGNDNANGETEYGMMLREGITGDYKNIIIANFGKSTVVPIYVELDGSQDNIGSTLNFGGNISYNNASDDYSSLAYSLSDVGLTVMDPQFTDPANFDFTLQSGSPAATSGVDVPSDDFYKQVDFSGAVGVSGSENDWTTGATWIKWQ